MIKRLFFIISLGVSSGVFAQSNLLEEDKGFGYVQPSFTMTILEAIDWLETDLFLLTHGSFTMTSSFRIDEEVPYSDSNKALLKGVHFFDFDIRYTLKNMTLSLTVENLLNIADRDFEVEPEYVDVFETVSVFTHQPNTLLSIALVYTF